ncbi:MAG: TSCPD domain-containing protein, partial [Deltaproteobacteria bacterium]|nr:TSCPD domain-containing protein [Deltaproteobacteria bacterium]
MRHEFTPSKKICPKSIAFDITDGRISGLSFDGGCPGNLKGIGRLAEGRDALEVAGTLAGITCGNKTLSCPSELSRAIYRAMGRRPPGKPAKAATPRRTGTAGVASAAPARRTGTAGGASAAPARRTGTAGDASAASARSARTASGASAAPT